MENTKHFIDWAKKNKWQVEVLDSPVEIPQKFNARYGNSDTHKDYNYLLTHVSLMANEVDEGWFLTAYDFGPDSEVWPADAFEKMSIEWSDGNQELIKNIINFWDNHIPIFFSVGGEYEYYAINTGNNSIVHGEEPEFEEVTQVASNFFEFLEKIMKDEIVL